MRRIFITPGEPAGIGPELVIRLAQKAFDAELVVVADPSLLLHRANEIKEPLELSDIDITQAKSIHLPGKLKIIPVNLAVPAVAGQLEVKNASYVLDTLLTAAGQCLSDPESALVTGPIHKGIINQAGIAFSGHTEFLAKFCKIEKTVMLFVIDQLRIALVTTHLPLAEVPKAITKENLTQTLTILKRDLRNYFGIINPRILVCGLNPHAGEGGYIGQEEVETITPLLDKLRQDLDSVIEGPLPADTIFTPRYLQKADAILAMYHDQALPIVKYIGFGHAVNVTLGLPFIRTSVDHGTALDIAASYIANPSSFLAALNLAIKLLEFR